MKIGAKKRALRATPWLIFDFTLVQPFCVRCRQKATLWKGALRKSTPVALAKRIARRSRDPLLVRKIGKRVKTNRFQKAARPFILMAWVVVFYFSMGAFVNTIRELSVLEVACGRSAGWKAPRDSELLVQEGTLWITRPGDLSDYWVGAGERFFARRGEILWIGADAQRARALVEPCESAKS